MSEIRVFQKSCSKGLIPIFSYTMKFITEDDRLVFWLDTETSFLEPV